MESKHFSWTFDKLQVVVSYLADQQRYNCAFSGQNREGVYKTDLAFYNSDPAFANLPFNRRHNMAKMAFTLKYTDMPKRCVLRHNSLMEKQLFKL